MELLTLANARKTGVPPAASDWTLCARFYCAKARLAVEIDGASHDMGDRPQRDMRRDAWLERQRVTVVRIAASDLTRQIDETADAIVRMATDLTR